MCVSFYHGWNHAEAEADTARQVEQLVGWKWGGGIYFNYFFVLVWVGDVCWSWYRPTTYRQRHRGIGTAIHTFLISIAVSGAIAFEDGPTRWVGLVVCGLLLIMWWRQRTGSVSSKDN